MRNHAEGPRPDRSKPDHRWRRLRSVALLSGFALAASACTIQVPETTAGDTSSTVFASEGGPTSATSTTSPETDATESSSTTSPTEIDPVQDPQVDTILQSYGPWRAEDLPPFTDDRSLTADTFDAPNRVVVTCEPALQSRTFSPGVFTDFAAFPFSGDVRPGLIVDGSGIEDGDLRVLPLDRAPIPLVIDLASDQPTAMITNPTPSTLQRGVADLVRGADARLTGLPVVPADIRFSQRTVSSYEEAVLSMGVSLRYDSPSLQAEFKSAFEQRQGTERHSVMVRLLQPMFTINVDRSGVTAPGDFFGTDVSADDVARLASQGRLGSDNPPVLIDAVTYGRVVYMTITSTTVTSSDDLLAAVSGAYNGFSGDATVREQHRQVISESEIRVEAFGGDDDVALNALRSGEIQDFMEQVNTSNAAPLSIVFRTLDGTKLEVTDQATITDIGCTRTTKPNEIGAQIDVGNASSVTLRVNGTEIATYSANTSQYVDLTPHLRTTGNNRVEMSYRPPTCIGGSMTTSFRLNGTSYQDREWRMAGHAGEWVCAETGTWNVNAAAGTIVLASGPPALRETT